MKPVTAATVGNVRAALQVLATVMSANGGNTTALVLTASHAAVAEAEVAVVLPQSAVSWYCTPMAQQPGVLVNAAEAAASVLYVVALPPGAVIVHTLVKPVTAATVGNVRAALQVLGTVMSANAGNTTALVLTASHAAADEAVLAVVLPQAAASWYCTPIAQHPEVFVRAAEAAASVL